MKSAMNCFLLELPCRTVNISGRVNLKLSVDLNYRWIVFAIIPFITLVVRIIEKEYLGLYSRFRDNSSKQTDCICLGIEGNQAVDNDRKGSAVLFTIGKADIDDNEFRSDILFSIRRGNIHTICNSMIMYLLSQDPSYFNPITGIDQSIIEKGLCYSTGFFVVEE